MTNTLDVIDAGWHPLASGHPPAWASGWGQDSYGVFVDFRVADFEQRMRWIPPGRFKMGSPETEAGRYEREGPRHEVLISSGYWLFEAPCTQALWKAVMGKNPSRFRSALRPVEGVSWEACGEFLGRVNEAVPGLSLELPTEAQWEYACRAGTETATYAGEMEILGQHNAPVLDEIAWYGGNSGVDFDLEGGFDSSDWGEKQYDHSRAGTREVKLKAPNAWGLYDMLGNVWEWCGDGRRDYSKDEQIDPHGPHGPGRVIRGGGWVVIARFVRAAFRYAIPPGNRVDSLGFRCARVQE